MTVTIPAKHEVAKTDDNANETCCTKVAEVSIVESFNSIACFKYVLTFTMQFVKILDICV